MKITLLFFISLILFVSCKGDEKKHLELNNINKKETLFNWSCFFNDSEMNVSFPIWFNDSLVKLNNIKTITRKIYASFQKDDVFSLPKELKKYTFNKKGNLIELHVAQYYENMMVGAVTFKYFDIKDKMGYSHVEKVKNKHPNIESIDDYVIHKKIIYTNKYLFYSSEENHMIYFMLDKKNWGALSIDSVLNPSPDDIVILGSPKMPHKKFQVENLVNESNVIEMSYNSSAMISKTSFEKYPFYVYRDMEYDKNGVCTGYIDSTFNSDQYLMHYRTKFIYNETSLPIVIQKRTEDKKGYVEYEKIEYEYFGK